MQKFDIQPMAVQLNLLAEVYEKKPVTVRALEVWFDTLKEFPAEQVLGILIGWPKTHHKFPVPAEVWKACNEKSIDRREDEALQMKMDRAPVTQTGKLIVGRIREIMALPRRSPREHWEHVLSTHSNESIGHRFAREALRLDVVVDEREPGCDDEPILATRYMPGVQAKPVAGA
jgi:hypothetical protein